MQNKSLQQYQAEIEQLRAAMQIPGVPPDEAAIYANTIQKIEAKIIDLHRAAPQPTAKELPATKPPSNSGEGMGVGSNRAADTTPIPVRVIRAGIDKPRHSQPTAPASDEKPHIPVLAAVLTGGLKQVLIEWGHGKSDLLTEGEARSRFTTALRDLSESRMAKLERYDDLARYITFSRAVAYYRVLIEFWLSPPTPRQLAINPLSRVRETIFDMIMKAACAAQTQP